MSDTRQDFTKGEPGQERFVGQVGGAPQETRLAEIRERWVESRDYAPPSMAREDVQYLLAALAKTRRASPLPTTTPRETPPPMNVQGLPDTDAAKRERLPRVLRVYVENRLPAFPLPTTPPATQTPEIRVGPVKEPPEQPAPLPTSEQVERAVQWVRHGDGPERIARVLNSAAKAIEEERSLAPGIWSELTAAELRTLAAALPSIVERARKADELEAQIAADNAVKKPSTRI